MKILMIILTVATATVVTFLISKYGIKKKETIEYVSVDKNND